jgi:hypothetical protein
MAIERWIGRVTLVASTLALGFLGCAAETGEGEVVEAVLLADDELGEEGDEPLFARTCTGSWSAWTPRVGPPTSTPICQVPYPRADGQSNLIWGGPLHGGESWRTPNLAAGGIQQPACGAGSDTGCASGTIYPKVIGNVRCSNGLVYPAARGGVWENNNTLTATFEFCPSGTTAVETQCRSQLGRTTTYNTRSQFLGCDSGCTERTTYAAYGWCCGNGHCDSDGGEDGWTCPQDCGPGGGGCDYCPDGRHCSQVPDAHCGGGVYCCY